MSLTAAGRALTALHREEQLGIRAATIADLMRLWPLFDPNVASSWRTFEAAAATLIASRNRASAGLAARYFTRFRALEGVEGSAAAVIADILPAEQISRSLASTGLAGVIRGLSVGQTQEAALRNGFVRVSGGAGRLVLAGGRDTIVASAGADRSSGRWERVTGGKPCEFCAMLAGRGAVYAEQTADFQAHDHCACSAEPAY